MVGCCLRLKEILPTLAPAEQRVARFVLDFPEDVVSMPIDELASSCQTSTASVVRLCKTVGYSGFKELCRVLSADLSGLQSSVSYEDVRPGDSVSAIARSVCLSDMKAIESMLSLIDLEQLDRAVSALCLASRIDFYGVGTSGLVAKDAHNKFLRINKLTYASFDPHEQVLSATSLKRGDVAVLISYSGETQDILETCEVVAQTGATMVSITKYGKNPLSERVDIPLFTSSSESMIRSGAMGSRIAQMTMVDVLYTAVSSRMYDQVKPYLDKTRLASQRKRARVRKRRVGPMNN